MRIILCYIASCNENSSKGYKLAVWLCYVLLVVSIGFEKENVTAQESAGQVIFRVVKTGSAAIQLTVLFTTEDVEATGKTHVLFSLVFTHFDQNDSA